MELSTIYTTLENLEKMHRSLYELALTKTETVKANDIEQLDRILKTEQAHVAAIETLEQQRQTQVKEYMQLKGYLPSDTPTVTQLIEAAQGEELEPSLIAIRERLIHLVEKLKEQNDLNQKLVFQSLQFVNLSLQMMRPQPQEQVNYSDREVLGQQTIAKKSYFDSQA